MPAGRAGAGAGRAAQSGGDGDAVLRRGRRGRARRGDGARGQAAQPDRSHAARQGVDPVRQPLRRGDERAARLRRLLRGDATRPTCWCCWEPTSHTRTSCPARTPSRSTTTRPGWGGAPPLELAVHGDVGATLRAVLPLVEQKPDRSFLDRMLHRHAEALEHVVSAYTHDIEHHLPIHPEYAAQHPRRGRLRGRRVHRRHRDEQRVGGALHHPQRPAAGDRLVPPRLDGQRAAARDRRAAGLPRAAGDLDVRRRRARHAARRAPDRRDVPAAGQDRHLQQLRARDGQARDARRRAARLPDRQRQLRLRGDRQRGRDPRRPRRAAGRCPRPR